MAALGIASTPFGERDPEAVGAKRIEVPDFSGRVLGLRRAAAPSNHTFDDRIPIATPAKIVGHRSMTEMDLALIEGDLHPFSPGAELDVSDFLGIDRIHETPPTVRAAERRWLRPRRPAGGDMGSSSIPIIAM